MFEGLVKTSILTILCFVATVTGRNTAWNHHRLHQKLHRRADCTSVQVVSGDSCGSLARKCAISEAEFTQYNSDSSLCSTLIPGQHVCCSNGTLPDLMPKSNDDGSCASYVVVLGDSCSAIAASNGLTVESLESFNKETWGYVHDLCQFLSILKMIQNIALPT